MMSQKNNFGKVATDLRARKFKLQAELKQAWENTGVSFISKITTEQMTGRPGLNVQTGNLRRSWHYKVKASMSEISLIVANAKRGWYAIVHQTGKVIRPKVAKYLKFSIGRGAGKMWISTKEVTIPKRLHITEDWKSWGIPDLISRTRRVYNKFLNNN